jgi:hypothetical protein
MNEGLQGGGGVKAPEGKPGQGTGWKGALKKTQGYAGAGGAMVMGAAAGAGMALGGAAIRGGKKAFLGLTGQWTWLLAVVAFFINFVHVTRGNTSFSPADPFFLIYLCIAVLATYLFYGDKSDPFPLKRLGKFMLFTIIAYYLPVGINWLGANFIPVELARMLMIFAPLWVIYVVLNPGDGLSRLIGFLFLIGWLGYIILAIVVPSYAGNAEISSVMPTAGEMRTTIASALEKMRTGVEGKPQQFYNSTRNFFTGQVDYATQDYYTGQVDQAQGLPMGVFITDTQPMYSRFRSEDDLIVIGTLRARTLADNLSIDTRCYLDFGKSGIISSYHSSAIYGNSTPRNIRVDYTGEFQDKYALDCTVRNDQFRMHIDDERNRAQLTSASVVFNATFDFDTWAYAEYAFMDRQLMQAFRLERLEPADAMRIRRTLQPKYTPGPLMMGMPSDSLPIPYDGGTGDNANLPAFGVTLTNSWHGKGGVNNFKTLEFFLPKPFELKLDECTPREGTRIMENAISYSRPINWSENNAYNHYVVSNVAIRPGETFITVRCPMRIGDTRNHPVLGTSGASRATFFVHARYSYSTWANTLVLIQRTPQ